jgi:hypothetical protein
MTADALSVMIQKEQSAYGCNDYLPVGNNDPEVATADARRLLVDWCFAIIDACNFQRETVSIAMNMFDRFLSIQSIESIVALQNQSELQLLAVSSLYIAIKINERVAFSSEFLANISRGGYTVQEIEVVEKIILKGLSWRINGPTVLQMAMHILSLMNVSRFLDQDSKDTLLNKVKQQSESVARDYDLSIQRPSTLALTILFRSFQKLAYEERVELFIGLVPLLQEFDFDKSCKKSIAVRLMRGSMSRCERMMSTGNVLSLN